MTRSDAHRSYWQLAGVTCKNCINKIHRQLQTEQPDCQLEINLTTQQATLDSSLNDALVQELIRQLGYQATVIAKDQLIASEPRLFQVTGVKCNGCVNKIRSLLLELDHNLTINADIEQQQLQITSTLSDATIIQSLDSLGYTAPESKAEASKEPSGKIIDAESGTPELLSTGTHTPQPDRSEPNHPPTIHLTLQGITCAGCVKTIEQTLSHTPGVIHADVNFANRTATVQGSSSADTLINAITNAGYGAQQVLDQRSAQRDQQTRDHQEYRTHIRHTLIGLGVGLPLMVAGFFVEMDVSSVTEQWSWGAIGLITLLVLLSAGRHFFVSGWHSIRNHNANMDLLIAIGTGSAWLYSMVVVLIPESLPVPARALYFEASAMIIGLINLGQALEVRARGKTSSALKRLLDLQPNTARVVRNNEEKDIPIEQVQVGDSLRIRPGEKIPVDGTISDGNSYVDESMLSGEPLAIKKNPGDALSAGTINQKGSLLYQATRIGNDSLLGQIISLVQQAQNSKPPISKLADQVSSVFVPAVMIIAVITALIWFNLGPEPIAVHMLVTATTVLIIACPCALGLATPISVMIGIGKAAEMGVLIRHGDALQKASTLDAIVMDKTGTLTQGRPSVTIFDNFSNIDNAHILNIVHLLESNSEHPLAEALVTFNKLQRDQSSTKVTTISSQKLSHFTSISGQGVSGILDGGVELLLGNQRLMEQHQISLSSADATASNTTGTVAYLAVDQKLCARFIITDPIKTTSKSAIDRLHKEGMRVIMLTGDNADSAQKVAQQLGIDEVHANLLPADKLLHIQQLQQQGLQVAMCGDGINDAPALAKADVGFAMGTGTDIAMESADITLVRGSLHGVADAIELSRATLRNIKQNLWGAFLYNSLGIPIAAGVLYPLTGMLLSPVIAGVAMSLSSLTVVSNASRLKRFKSTRPWTENVQHSV